MTVQNFRQGLIVDADINTGCGDRNGEGPCLKLGLVSCTSPEEALTPMPPDRETAIEDQTEEMIKESRELLRLTDLLLRACPWDRRNDQIARALWEYEMRRRNASNN